MILPVGLKKLMASALGGVFQWIGPRKDVIESNLCLAFPDQSDSEKKLRRDRVNKIYRHLAFLLLESSLNLGAMKRFVEKNVRVEGLENFKKAHAKKKGVVILGSHMGNWEVMGSAIGLSIPRFLIVSKAFKPRWLHEQIESLRKKCGQTFTYEPKTLKDILSTLKSGETVGMVLDQYAGPPIGIRVPVFGVPVGTNSAVASIVRRTQAAVIPVVNYRTPQGNFVVKFLPEAEWITGESREQEIGINTAHYVKIMENQLFEHPEQWLWTHRRFKGDLSPLKAQEWELGRQRA